MAEVCGWLILRAKLHSCFTRCVVLFNHQCESANIGFCFEPLFSTNGGCFLPASKQLYLAYVNDRADTGRQPPFACMQRCFECLAISSKLCPYCPALLHTRICTALPCFTHVYVLPCPASHTYMYCPALLHTRICTALPCFTHVYVLPCPASHTYMYCPALLHTRICTALPCFTHVYVLPCPASHTYMYCPALLHTRIGSHPTTSAVES